MRVTETLQSVCQHGTPLLPIAPWKYAKIKTRYTRTLCAPKTYHYLFPNPNPSARTRELFVMTSCAHNDVVGLRNRYFKETVHDFKPDEKILAHVLDVLCDKLRPHFQGPLSLEEFLGRKKGAMARRYDDAGFAVLKDGYDPTKHSKISAFIKNEAYDELKPPRMIMGRDPRFNLLYGCFTTALEDAMVHLPQVSKGRNFSERGQQFSDRLFLRWILECDFSKYESTQRLSCLAAIELGIWRRLLDDAQYLLICKIFAVKMFKSGYTLNDVYFFFLACRGSGDMDTGLFNTLLTWCACYYFLYVNSFPCEDFICDGDDNGVAIPIGSKYVSTYHLFGFDAKLILRKDYHDFDYCSGKFIEIKPGVFHFVQNLNKLMQTVRLFRKEKFRHCLGTYYHSLGYMYTVMYPGIPVFQEIGKFLMSFSKNKRYVSYDMLHAINPNHAEAFSKSRNLVLDVDPQHVTVEIALSFDMSVEEVRRYQQYYLSSTIELLPSEDKRFNTANTPAVRLTIIQANLVESTLKTAYLSWKPKPWQAEMLLPFQF